MSAPKALALSAALLLVLWHGSAAHAARETEANDRPTAGVGDVGSSAGAVVSGADLVGMVERQLVGARVFDLSFNDQGAAPSFDVKSYRAGTIWNTVIDAATGQIVQSAILMPASDLHAEDRRNIDAFRRSNMTLGEAMAIAEKYGPGKAISAGLHREAGRLVFVVVVVSDGALKEIVISPDGRKRGKRIEIEAPPGDEAPRPPA